MKAFEYGDEEIGSKEIMLGVSSMVIGIGVLTLPRLIANVTESSDGWMSIMIAGIVSIMLAWVAAKLASRFPKMTFITYTELIVTKPAAVILTCFMFIYFILFAAYITRGVATITHQYLFVRTPVEVIALIFLLVITYAVAGSRVGLLRLNLLFLPIVLFIVALLLSFSTGIMELRNLKPYFITNWTGILQGARESTYSLLGFEIVLFYITYMTRPKQAPKAVVIGMIIPIILYMLVYMIVISVFSVDLTREVMYPTIELAKEIELPGQFFERLESVFFVIWIMTIFNTGSMALDLCILSINSIFKQVNKMTFLLILAPLIYIVASMPQDLIEFSKFGEFISYLGLVIGGVIPCSLFIIAIVRGVKGHA